MEVLRLEKWCSQWLEGGGFNKGVRAGSREKLTVVILSYGRQDFLLRQVVYWGNDAAKVVIVDGSVEPLSKSAQEVISTQQNITYIHLPEKFTARLVCAASHIETPYAVLLGDDEFLLKDSLSKTIKKLEDDPALVACIGQSLGFYLSRDARVCTYDKGYRHWKYEVMQDDVRGRLITAMKQYNAATCYAVLRQPVWSRSWGSVQNWSSPYACEMQQAITTYIWGKVTTIDEVYWLRSHENAPVSNKGFDRKLLFRDWWLSPKFEQERKQFVGFLANEAKNTKAIDVLEAKNMILAAMAEFDNFIVKHYQIQKVSRSKVDTFMLGLRSMVISAIEGVLPEKQARKIKENLSRLIDREQRGSLGSLNNLTQNQAAAAFRLNDTLVKELEEIEFLVSGFYEVRRS